MGTSVATTRGFRRLVGALLAGKASKRPQAGTPSLADLRLERRTSASPDRASREVSVNTEEREAAAERARETVEEEQGGTEEAILHARDVLALDARLKLAEEVVRAAESPMVAKSQALRDALAAYREGQA